MYYIRIGRHIVYTGSVLFVVSGIYWGPGMYLLMDKRGLLYILLTKLILTENLIS